MEKNLEELVSGFDAYTDVDELAAAMEASSSAKTPGFSITPTFSLTGNH
ncbi:LxmA leader domain family RiPP [Streptomyces sp. NPDC096191]